MAQVMKYWNWPVHGQGAHSYVHYAYGTLSANFAGATYDWAMMNDSLTASNLAVAQLMSHCGIAVDMDYNPGGSSAYVSEQAFENYFKYSLSAHTIYRDNIDSLLWNEILKKELDEGRPILYAGFPQPPMPIGHAWVVDGYDSNDFFHFNWGWSGIWDGYFQMGNFTYAKNNIAVIGVMPIQQSDMAMIDLESPVSATFTVPVPIRIRVANYDTLPLTNVPVAYQVDGGAVVMDVITTSIPPLSEFVFEFTQLCDLTAQPGHTYDIKVYTAGATDAYRGNDTLHYAVEHVICADIPYCMGFEPGESLTGWVNEDVMENGPVWYFGNAGGHNAPGCYYTFPYADPANDWLITKCLSLDTARLYRLSFWYRSTSSLEPAAFGVYMGSQAEAIAMTTLLQEFPNLMDQNYTQAQIYFSVPSVGNHYLGWWCNSPAYSPGILIDDICIEEANAPDVGIVSHIAPTDGCDLNEEPVSVEVRNYCSASLHGIPMKYRVNGGVWQTDTISDTLSPGETLTFTFASLCNLWTGGTFNFDVVTALTADTLNNNDTLHFSVRNVVSAVLPYAMGFEVTEDLSDWLVENTNEDGFQWHYTSSGGHNAPRCAIYEYSSWDPADDWLFSKCLFLQIGYEYRLRFWYKIESNQWPEDLAVYVGGAQNSLAMTQLIVDLPNLVNMNYLQSWSLFSVPSDGHYYLGFKCYSDALMFNLYIDDIDIEGFTIGVESNLPTLPFNVYPNPSQDGVFILSDRIGMETEKSIRVLGMDGRLVLERSLSGTNERIDLSQSASGLYVLLINVDGQQYSYKLLKE
jgi:hypothetical protein